MFVRLTYAREGVITLTHARSLAPALKAGKAAEERAPAAELITNARRFMDVTFSLDVFASFKISGH